MIRRLHTILTLDGLELASERVEFSSAGVTLHEPVIYKGRGQTKYTTMHGVISRTVPWSQIKYVDLTTGEA